MSPTVDVGLEEFRASLKGKGIEVVGERRFSDRKATYFEVGNNKTSLDLVIPDEFFADLPATKQYQTDLRDWVLWLQKRIGNHDAKSFINRNGIAVSLEITWPPQRYGTEISLHAQVKAIDTGQIAKIYVCIFDPHWLQLQGKPFLKHKAFFSATRQALDDGILTFYRESEHPHALQRVDFRPEPPPSQCDDEKVRMFIAHKVYWLGFKTSDQQTETWICDPWDDEYLGVDIRSLKQNAQLLKAAGLIALDASSEYATAQDKLILAMTEASSPDRPSWQIGFTPNRL